MTGCERGAFIRESAKRPKVTLEKRETLAAQEGESDDTPQKVSGRVEK